MGSIYLGTTTNSELQFIEWKCVFLSRGNVNVDSQQRYIGYNKPNQTPIAQITGASPSAHGEAIRIHNTSSFQALLRTASELLTRHAASGINQEPRQNLDYDRQSLHEHIQSKEQDSQDSTSSTG